MNDEALESKSAARVSARRRLVRGVFAAPAALTLYSGGVAASSAGRCIVNQTLQPAFPLPGSGLANTWVRVQAYKQGNDTLFNRSELLSILGTAPLSSSISSTYPYWKAVYPVAPYTGNVNAVSLLSGQYLAVVVDKSGEVIGVSNGTVIPDASAVAKTCWQSFSGVQAFPF